MDSGAGAGPSDAGWANTPPDGDNGPALASYLDFLSEGLLLGNEAMDPCTLAAVNAAAHAGEQQQRPARRGKDELFPYVPEEQYAGGGNDLDNSEEEEDEQPAAKRGKRKASSAATSKANREKARREKINDKFLELARLVEPDKDPKTDKLSILSEAIRFVNQTMVENSQLKQLNKFLEEKVASFERERTSMMGGAHMMQQQYHHHQLQQQQFVVPPGMMVVPQYMVAQPQMQPMQHMQAQQQQQQQPFALPGPQQQPQVPGLPAPSPQQQLQQQQALPQGYMASQTHHQQQQQQQQQQQLQLKRTESCPAPDASTTAPQHSQLQHQHSLQQPAQGQPPMQQQVLGPQIADAAGPMPQQAMNQQAMLQPMGSADGTAAPATAAAPMPQALPMYMPPMAGKPGAAMMMAGGLPGGMMQHMPYFVQQSMLDSTKDSQLRPPAA